MSIDSEKFDETIRQLVPIRELSTSSQNQIINQSQIISFTAESYIFKQGDKDEYTFYLLDGALEMQAVEEASFNVTTKEERAIYPLAQIQPRKYSAKAVTPVKVLRLNRNMIEGIVAQEKYSDTNNGLELNEDESEESLDWMSLILQSSFFSKIPASNIQQLFVMLEPVNKRAGETVIKQGDTGDYYYIIQEGRCEVTRASTTEGETEKLAELNTGDSFGEESLLSDKPRNATVTMLTDGILMQLSKENFIELIKKPILDSVSFDEAQKTIDEGGVWLDVRSHNEYNESNITDSINIPIFDIRRESDKLQINKKYIIYSNTKRRGAAAAFLLTELGFNVRYLENGIASIPDNIKSNIFYKKEVLEKDNEKITGNVSSDPEAPSEEKVEKQEMPGIIDNVVEQDAVTKLRSLRKKLQEKIKNIIVKKQERANFINDKTGKNEEDIKEEKKENEELQKLTQVTDELIKKERKTLELLHIQRQESLDNKKKNIEEELKKIHATLKEIQTASEEAEKTRQTAEEEARELKERHALAEEEISDSSLNKLNEEIKSAEQKHNQVQKKLVYAHQAEKTIKSAKERNEQEMMQYKEEEKMVQRQLDEEMTAWSKEKEEYEEILKQAQSHEAHDH